MRSAFVNARGETQFGKWVFEPVGGVLGLSDDKAKARGANFLFDELRQRARDGELAFNVNLELAQPGDKLDNATVPLPEGRKKLTLGVLKVTAVSQDAWGDCLNITFKPLVLPKGVQASADPMLAASAAPLRRVAGTPPYRGFQAVNNRYRGAAPWAAPPG